MRILALLTDALGGHGGIAQYNRDLLTAVCEYPDCTEVFALPRLMHHQRDPLPAKLTYSLKGLGGRLKYVVAVRVSSALPSYVTSSSTRRIRR